MPQSFILHHVIYLVSQIDRMMELSVEWDSDDFAAFLTSEGLHDDVVTKIIDNRVTSALFIELSEDDLKELAPVIGDRMALRKVLERAKKVIQSILLPYLVNFFITESTSDVSAFCKYPSASKQSCPVYL